MNKRRKENAAFLLPPYMPMIFTRTIDGKVDTTELRRHNIVEKLTVPKLAGE